MHTVTEALPSVSAAVNVRAHDASSSRTRTTARKPRRGILKDVVLAIFGTLGVLAVAWLIVAQVTGASVVVFETGSMSPTIPQGGASISVPTDASDLKVGDIVTARLDDAALPVTHRIVSIDPDPRNPDGRMLTLKGDANATPDLFPYPVTRALKVVVGGAGFGTVVTALKSPLGIGSLFTLVALLVLWAFWPTRRHPQRGHKQRGAHAQEQRRAQR